MLIKDILNLIKSATSLPIKFINSDKVEKCIIYNLTPINDDGIKRQDRLEIQIVGFDILDIETIDLQIRKALLSFGDRTDCILSIELNGGGVLRDNNIKSLSKYSFYVITTKSEV